MTRRPSRVWRVVEQYRDSPFEYGKHDCCLFAARCIDEVTGASREAELLTQYHDERSARRFMARSGGIEAAISERLGKPVDGYCARRGDVCFVPVEGGMGVGVCVGGSIAVAAQNGLEFYPLSMATKHWRVD